MASVARHKSLDSIRQRVRTLLTVNEENYRDASRQKMPGNLYGDTLCSAPRQVRNMKDYFTILYHSRPFKAQRIEPMFPPKYIPANSTMPTTVEIHVPQTFE